MKKLSNKQYFIWIKILFVCLSYMPLGLFITSRNFSLNFYYNILPLGNEFRQYWFSENFYNLLVCGFITLGIFIVIIFQYKFKISENFQVGRNTVIIGGICIVISIGAIVYSHFANNYSWQILIGESIKLLLGVSVFEELIYRGFITNEIFRLKEHGIKIYAGIVISAILFGLMHLPAYFLYNEISIGGAIFRFIFPTIIGLAYATILYYKKDIISLILIHTASNICGSIAGQPFDIIFFVLMCLYALILIPAVKRHLPFKMNALI